jgi:hypothetical protein
VIRTVALSVGVALAVAAPVRAHALSAEARIRGHEVVVEAYFSDNTPARGARVTVHDVADKLIADGHTDDNGSFRFPTPPPGTYQVVVDAGSGHRKRLSITVPNEAASDAIISTGPSREEFTRFPFGGVAAGLTIIGLLALGWRAWRRRPRLSR